MQILNIKQKAKLLQDDAKEILANAKKGIENIILGDGNE